MDTGARLLDFYAVLRALTIVVATAALAAPTTVAQPTHARLAARSIVAEINIVRADHGLRPVRLARPLTAAAGQHSNEMGVRGYFSHDSADGTSFWKRVGEFYGSRGYRYWSVGENLLWSSGELSPASAVTMWMNSPTHRKNLLDSDWRQIGLSVKQFTSAPGVYHGLTVTIVTADFGTRSS
jgi:uncharacterized protein YkwD